MALNAGATRAVTTSWFVLAGTLGKCPALAMTGPASAAEMPLGAPGVGCVKYLRTVPPSVTDAASNCACIRKSVLVALMFSAWMASTLLPACRYGSAAVTLNDAH